MTERGRHEADAPHRGQGVASVEEHTDGMHGEAAVTQLDVLERSAHAREPSTVIDLAEAERRLAERRRRREQLLLELETARAARRRRRPGLRPA